MPSCLNHRVHKMSVIFASNPKSSCQQYKVIFKKNQYPYFKFISLNMLPGCMCDEFCEKLNIDLALSWWDG